MKFASDYLLTLNLINFNLLTLALKGKPGNSDEIYQLIAVTCYPHKTKLIPFIYFIHRACILYLLLRVCQYRVLVFLLIHQQPEDRLQMLITQWRKR
jgi:hypothetical protein